MSVYFFLKNKNRWATSTMPVSESHLMIRIDMFLLIFSGATQLHLVCKTTQPPLKVDNVKLNQWVIGFMRIATYSLIDIILIFFIFKEYPHEMILSSISNNGNLDIEIWQGYSNYREIDQIYDTFILRTKWTRLSLISFTKQTNSKLWLQITGLY